MLVELEPGDISFNGAGLPAGSTIQVKAGDYSKLQFHNLAGIPSNPIVITNHEGQVRVRGEDWVTLRGCEHVWFAGSGAGYGFLFGTTFHTWDGSSHIEYERIEMNHGRMRINNTLINQVTSGFHVHHCKFGSYGSTLLYVGHPNAAPGEYMTQQVSVHHNLFDDSHGSGIKVVQIEDCEIRDNLLKNVNLVPYDDKGPLNAAIRLSGYLGNTRVYRNVVDRARTRGVYLEECSGQMWIFNNLFTDCGRGGEECSESYRDVIYSWRGDDCRIFNNTIIGASRHGIRWAGVEPINSVAFNNIILGTGGEPVVGIDTHRNLTSEVEDFGFVNPVVGDYHLTSDSPAVNAGIEVPGLTDDLDGKPRPAGVGWDVGCYEYQPAGCYSK